MNIPRFDGNAPVIAGNRPTVDKETGRIHSDDPALESRKLLLEKVFGVKFHDEDDEETQTPDDTQDTPVEPVDTVELSAEAVELQRRQRVQVEQRTPDGTLRVTVESEQRVSARMQQTVQSADPLVIDLDGDGVELTDVTAGGGPLFDITGDGVAERVSWVTGGDGLLALDRNGNGLIDSGLELFGEQHGAADGFSELAAFDQNGDLIIDNNDSIYADLRVWVDRDADGTSQENELSSLADLDIHSISLQADTARAYVAGNRVSALSSYEAGARTGAVAEVHLNFLA